ncbi:hypothetical protein [Photorhabdus bodei]|uniref:Uncharacterized protein n=1 Tax=Photorhabdus bodei TaxID=2029681 RepID=A0AAW6BQH3_9GAMM|nr:hypothetical protein [Photorhabdus bodei]MDB6375001.1 hypothetical protein [Photorhabdus bodei]
MIISQGRKNLAKRRLRLRRCRGFAVLNYDHIWCKRVSCTAVIILYLPAMYLSGHRTPTLLILSFYHWKTVAPSAPRP